MTELTLAILVFLGLPMFLLVFFKTNAGMMFLASCSGLVLLGSLDPVVVTAAGAVLPSEGESYVRLFVVALAIVFSALVFRGTIHGSKLFLHGAIVVFLAGLLCLQLPSSTGLSWMSNITSDPVWVEVNNYESLIIAAGFSLSLVGVLTAQSRKKSKH